MAATLICFHGDKVSDVCESCEFSVISTFSIMNHEFCNTFLPTHALQV